MKNYEVSDDQASYMKIIEGKTFHEYQLKLKHEQMIRKISIELKEIEKPSKNISNIAT
mgnify:CR=1 FL=1